MYLSLLFKMFILEKPDTFAIPDSILLPKIDPVFQRHPMVIFDLKIIGLRKCILKYHKAFENNNSDMPKQQLLTK